MRRTRNARSAPRAAFDEGPWRGATGVERADLLRAVAAGLRERAEEIGRVETLQQGHLVAESVDDVLGCARELDYYAGLACDRQGQPLKFEGSLSSAVTREPIGVVAAIVPWNYPIAIAVTKLAPALAAGNAVILKPASVTPLDDAPAGRGLRRRGAPPASSRWSPAPAARSAARSRRLHWSTWCRSPAASRSGAR